MLLPRLQSRQAPCFDVTRRKERVLRQVKGFVLYNACSKHHLRPPSAASDKLIENVKKSSHHDHHALFSFAGLIPEL